MKSGRINGHFSFSGGKMSRFITLSLVLLSLVTPLCLSVTAMAFDLSPMEMEYSPGDGQNSKTFTVENNASTPVAAQLRVYRRSSDANGVEQRTATDDFMVFPSQVMLGANEKRAIRVTFKGPSVTSEEKAYRLVAEQLPLSTDPVVPAGPKVQLKYLLKFVASIYVTPKKGNANVVVESVVPQGEKLQVTLANLGTKHKTLKGAHFLLKGQGRSTELEGESMKMLDQKNLLPGARTTIVVNRPANLPTGPVESEVQFN
jgi:fimbrial chaperone protein